MLKFTLSVLASICVLMASVAHAADNGLFMVVKGTVKVISGKDKSTATAKVGSKVFSGDTVVTEKDSRAKIVMADRNVLQLSPETKFEITNYKTSEVESERTAQLALMQGKVRAQVEQKYGEKNKFEMRTPTAVAGVRGTQYVIQYNPVTTITSVMVMNGKVMVAPTGAIAAAVPVTPNQGVNVGSSSTKLETFAVSKEQMNSFSNMSETKSLDTIKTDVPNTPANETKSDDKKREPSSSEGDRMAGPTNTGDQTLPGESKRAPDSTPNSGGPGQSPGVAPSPAPGATPAASPNPPKQDPPSILPFPPAIPTPFPTPRVIPTPPKTTKTKVIITPRPQQ